MTDSTHSTNNSNNSNNENSRQHLTALMRIVLFIASAIILCLGAADLSGSITLPLLQKYNGKFVLYYEKCTSYIKI